MALTEESRHQLFQRLEELLGLEEASTLMEMLPPVGWADVATKRDLDHLEERLGFRIDRLDGRIDRLEQRLDARIDSVESGLGARIDRLDGRFELFGAELRAELYRSQRNLAFGVIGANAAVLTVLLTAFRLI